MLCFQEPVTKEAKEHISSIFHRMQTSLSIIAGYADLICLDPQDENNRNTLHQEIKYLSSLFTRIQNANALQNQENQSYQKVSITSFIKNIYEKFSSINKHHEFSFSSEIQHEIFVKILPTECEEITRILLDNAFKYTLPKNKIKITLSLSDKNVIVSIRNEGVGISREDQKYIFDMFFRGKIENKVLGWGIGLSIAKSFADLQGLTLEVQSDEKSYVDFLLAIPNYSLS